MKILHRLVISPRPFTDKQIEERERMAEFLSIPGVLQVKNEYRHVPDILQKLQLEQKAKGADLDEHSLKEAVAEPGYHNIHLTLTTVEWRRLGIRMTLYGQAEEIDNQGITYGRRGTHLKYYTPDIQKAFTEITLVEWHELDHTLRALWGIDPTSTHYHFYGYATKYRDMPKKLQNEVRPRRFVRKPDPLQAWRALPWAQLPDLTEQEPEPTDLLTRLKLLIQILNLQLVLKKLREQLVVTEPTLVKPLRAWGQNVSQPYGNYNPTLYKLTGHHIGVDHAVVKGTPIYAPADGHIYHAGYNNVLGHFIAYKYADDRYLIALHLQSHPKATDLGAPIKAGEQIGTVGDTGLITGVHSHIEVWTVPVERDRVSAYINKETWRLKTRDPLKEF